MMFRSIVTLIFALMIVVSTALITSAQNRDEAQIRALQERQAAAWNQHDATAYASLFTEDGEVITLERSKRPIRCRECYPGRRRKLAAARAIAISVRKA